MKIGDVEIRFMADGSLDEVILCKNGECLFHMEYMDLDHIWYQVGDVHVHLQSTQPIVGSFIDDSESGEAATNDAT